MRNQRTFIHDNLVDEYWDAQQQYDVQMVAGLHFALETWAKFAKDVFQWPA